MTTTGYKVIGQAKGRKDGPPKVTGAARYTVDTVLPGMLYAKVVRSPHPHARIVSIDTSKAEAVPGVHAVLTGEDVAPHLAGNRVRDLPPLANDVVRFVGERVAAVVADDEETAERAGRLVEIEYEELPAIFAIDEGLDPKSPVLHPNMLSYAGYLKPPPEPSNVFFSTSYGIGDIDEGFKEADLVFEDEYTTQRVHPAFFEPRSCVVDANVDGRVHIWTTSKAPHGLKMQVSAAIGVEPTNIVVEPVYVGGDFGGKGCPFDEPLAYFCSKKAGRPVRMVMEYQEEFEAGNPRHESRIRMRTGVKKDGTVVAHHQDMVFNTGAYAALQPLGYLAGADRIAANWHIPHARFDHRQVYTNNVPGGYMRGPGEVQGTFAMESHFDEIAAQLGMDPVEFRRKNILHEGDMTPMNEKFIGVRAEEALLAAVEAAGYPKKLPPHHGIGISMASRPAGGGETHVEVTVEDDGSVHVRTPLFEQGSGSHTIVAQVVAEELGTTFESVSVESMDTDGTPFDSGIAGSRTMRMLGPAAHEAAVEARGNLLNTAAELTGWPVEQLISQDTRILNTASRESIGWAELLRRVPGQIVAGRASSKEQGLPQYTTFVAQVAEVRVDPETGEVKVLKFTSAHDVGTVLNPIGHQGQINGSFASGFGFALMEELTVENGRVLTQSFADVKIPTFADMPEMQTVLLESDEGDGPYKIRSVGEAPLLAVAPAIANAVRNASGVRYKDLPLTPEKVLAGLRAKHG
jgi:CO/xanthine dehydrogenase Mo-binding subunit